MLIIDEMMFGPAGFPLGGGAVGYLPSADTAGAVSTGSPGYDSYKAATAGFGAIT
mgnify:CR=1 FL=1